MYLVGVSVAVIANDSYLFEWKCVEREGVLLGVDIPSDIVSCFFVLEFKLTHTSGLIDVLVDSKETIIPFVPSPSPSPSPMITVSGTTYGASSPTSYSTWEGGIPASCFMSLLKDGAPWYVEDGDIISWRVMNTTGAMQCFKGGLKIGDAGVSNDVRWWADENGKPVRPLSFIERGLKIGTLIGSLRVVDGREWGKFDS
jgi:hypothetical protein